MSKLDQEVTVDHTDPKPPVSETQTNDTFDELVGEGKRYRTPADLAKAKLEADEHIKRIERENKEARDLVVELEARAAKAKRIDDAIAEVASSRRTDTATTVAVDEQVIDQRIEARERQKELARNLDEAENTLIKSTGDDEEAARKVLVARAKELGTTPKELLKTASTNPRMFYELMGLKKEASSANAGRPDGDVNTITAATTGTPDNPTEGTAAWYSKLRRENASMYLSPKIQAKMVRDAERLGQDFYK